MGHYTNVASNSLFIKIFTSIAVKDRIVSIMLALMVSKVKQTINIFYVLGFDQLVLNRAKKY